MEKQGYFKAILAIDITFPNEKDQMLAYKTKVKRTKDNKELKQNYERNKLLVRPSEISTSLEHDLMNREKELIEFRHTTQNAILSPLLTQAMVKKTECILETLVVKNKSVLETRIQPDSKRSLLIDKLRKASRMIVMMSLIFRGWKRYDYNILPKDKMTAIPKRLNALKFDASFVLFQSKLQDELTKCLRMQPEFRTSFEERKISKMLKKYRFFNFFPKEKEKFICNNIGYERYEQGRVICLQGRKSERFYYVISGLIAKVKTLRLAEGIKKLYHGDLHQGSSTDVEEPIHGWKRSCSLICKSDVEVILLERSDLLYIFKDVSLDPSTKSLLQSLPLFQTYPLKELLYGGGIQVKFFAKGAIIDSNINESIHFYIVKTGLSEVLLESKALHISRKISKYETAFVTQKGLNRKQKKKKNLQSEYKSTKVDYITVNLLNKGDIYGLRSILHRIHNIVQSSTSETISRLQLPEQRNTKLISSGTEIILVNKNKFLRHADFCTLSKLLCTEQGKEIYREKENSLVEMQKWKTYKSEIVVDVLRKSPRALHRRYKV